MEHETDEVADFTLLPSEHSDNTPSEIVVGIVSPIGVMLDNAVEQITETLDRFGYEVFPIRLARWLDEIPFFTGLVPEGDGYLEYIISHSTAAGRLRRATGLKDALARCGAMDIALHRRAAVSRPVNSPKRIAYVVRSFTMPEEVALFRDLYGSAFFLVSLTQEPSIKKRLLDDYAVSIAGNSETRDLVVAELLREDNEIRNPVEALAALDARIPDPVQEVLRDPKKDYRQDIGDTFPLADLFARVAENGSIDQRILDRFVELLHSHTFHGPSMDERGMAHAFSARLASLALARQVGAAIINPSGHIISTGHNDVPRPGGGLYGMPGRHDPFPDDLSRSLSEVVDARDHRLGGDVSDEIRREIFTDLIRRLMADPAWIIESLRAAQIYTESSKSPEEIADILEERFLGPQSNGKLARLIDGLLENSELLRSAEFFNVIEYGRTVHAEMTAVMAALEQGVNLRDATLYVTTFPCHECTRHIIAAGITRVVFVEPYVKSRGLQLHADAVHVRDAPMRTEIWTGKQPSVPAVWPGEDNRVRLEPFEGIAPRLHETLFQSLERKFSQRGRERERSRHIEERQVAMNSGMSPDELPTDDAIAAHLPGVGELVFDPTAPYDGEGARLRAAVEGNGRSDSYRLLNARTIEECTRFRYLATTMRRIAHVNGLSDFEFDLLSNELITGPDDNAFRFVFRLLEDLDTIVSK